jgi:putative membrane protein
MNRKSMRNAVLGAVVVLMPMALIGQMDPTNPQGAQNLPGGGQGAPQPAGQQPPTTMRDTLGAPGETGQQMSDKQFLRTATEGGLAEVKLGLLATQKGSPDVKEFGQKMVDDHTAINKDLAAVADSLGVMLPKKISKDAQAEYEKLDALSGDAFDKEYLAFMVKAHWQDLREFRAEASVAVDPGLQAEVVKAAMVIRQHLMMVSKLATDKGVPLPPRPPRPGTPPPPAATH